MRKRTGHLFKRGKYYYVRWHVQGKRFVKSTGETARRQAETEMERILEPFIVGTETTVWQNLQSRINNGQAETERLENERNPALTLSRSWDAYEEAPNRPDSGERTLKDYRGYLKAFIKWTEKKHPETLTLQNVSRDIASEYAGHLVRRGLSANSYNKHIGFLRLFFNVLKEPGRVTSNPWEDIRRKRVISESRRELTLDELKEVCQSAKGEFRILFALGIFGGLRLKDAALIQWGEVDLQRGVIRRIPAKVARRVNKPVVIPIHPNLGDMLAETPPRARKGDILKKTADAYRNRRDALTRQIKEHFEACGIETVAPGTGKGTGKRAVVRVGFHSLRHSFVSLCRSVDTPLSIVESLVGHSNPAMTRLYSHTSEDAARAAVLSLPGVIGDSPGKNPDAIRMIPSSEVQTLADKMNSKNWKRIKSELARLCDG